MIGIVLSDDFLHSILSRVTNGSKDITNSMYNMISSTSDSSCGSSYSSYTTVHYFCYFTGSTTATR